MFVVRHSAMTTRRFAAVFATTAAVAALTGGIGGLVLGQSHHTAPTIHPVQVGAAQSASQTASQDATANAVTEPAAATPVAATTVTRTVTVKQAAQTIPARTAAKPAKERKVTEPQTQAPADQPAAAQAAEPDPTPVATETPNYDQPEGPWQKGGQPTSMNGQPDPPVGGATTPAEPTPGTLPMHPVSE